MEVLYGKTTDLPKVIAIETGDGEIANTDPAVNAVLYRDVNFTNEQNDFFFESLEDAFGFCAETYGVARDSWTDLMAWVEVTH